MPNVFSIHVVLEHHRRRIHTRKIRHFQHGCLHIIRKQSEWGMHPVVASLRRNGRPAQHVQCLSLVLLAQQQVDQNESSWCNRSGHSLLLHAVLVAPCLQAPWQKWSTLTSFLDIKTIKKLVLVV
jgi:hypothetical protein